MNSLRRSAIARTLVCLVLGGLTALGCSGADQVGPNDRSESDVASTTELLTDEPITVLSATYGFRCGAVRDNALASVAAKCNNVHGVACVYNISEVTLGDPAPGCDKDFDVDFACGPKNTLTSNRQSVHTTQEANGKQTSLSCPQAAPTSGIVNIVSATYGGNCGAGFDNVLSDVSNFCDGWGHCKYIISERTIGDPARGCDKDFKATYSCSNNPTFDIGVQAQKEANGRYVSFDCP
jgi:hypothetical protein